MKMIRADQPIILRVLLLEHRNRLGPGTAGILLLFQAGGPTAARGQPASHAIPGPTSGKMQHPVQRMGLDRRFRKLANCKGEPHCANRTTATR
jgi:hypothetical protein